MTGALNFGVLPSDSPYILGSMLLRFLPPKDRNKKSILMSVLRVLSRNEDLAADPVISKPMGAKGMMTSRTMFSGMDNPFSRVLKVLEPFLEEHTGERLVALRLPDAGPFQIFAREPRRARQQITELETRPVSVASTHGPESSWRITTVGSYSKLSRTDEAARSAPKRSQNSKNFWLASALMGQV